MGEHNERNFLLGEKPKKQEENLEIRNFSKPKNENNPYKEKLGSIEISVRKLGNEIFTTD